MSDGRAADPGGAPFRPEQEAPLLDTHRPASGELAVCYRLAVALTIPA